jgi:hypothetical protein
MEVEHKEYASNAKGNTAVALGSVALGLAGLNAANNGCGNGGILGGLLGGRCGNGCGNGGMDAATVLALAAAGSGRGEDAVVNRYEAGLQARISQLETEVKLRDANTYTDSKLNALRDYFEAKLDKVNERLCHQAEWNATQTATITCMTAQIAQLFGLTKLVVPNTAVCPGWGNVTVAPATAAAA